MAFQRAAGYNNLPNGNFSPTIFSKKAQMFFRKTSVVQAITNSDYMGEIADYGDTVRIMKEPAITVKPYSRGADIQPQDLADEDFTLTVDQSNYYAFQVDDIEKQHAHHNWIDLASDRAAYELSDEMDTEVLGYMSGYVETNGVYSANTTVSGTKADSTAGNDELLAGNQLFRSDFLTGGTGTNSVSIAANSGTYATPLQILNRMCRIMDVNNVPKEGRWFVGDPIFFEVLGDEDSKYMSNDYAGGQDAGDVLRNGRVVNGLVRGFRVYQSNNLPSLGTGPGTIATAGSATNFGIVIAGHDSAVCTAEQITKSENYRSPTGFADVVRGLQLYGRKILRPEAIVTAAYNLAV